ncbi:GPP34 family phosphoprotein [Streptomyces sp. NPDC008238]
MTTPQDLLIVVMHVSPSPPVPQGDLSLALAGAELLDLLAHGAATLDGDLVVPGDRFSTGERLLDQAAAAVAPAPYESVMDWLWRRGRDLAAAYREDLRASGGAVMRRRHWWPLEAGELVLVDSTARREAVERWTSKEPVLVALAAAARVPADPGTEEPDVTDETVATVLAEVNAAVEELEAVRQRLTIEQEAYDNIWRAP